MGSGVDERGEDAQRPHVEVEADLLLVNARQADDGRGRGIADGLQLRLDAGGGLRGVFRVDDEEVETRVAEEFGNGRGAKAELGTESGLGGGELVLDAVVHVAS